MVGNAAAPVGAFRRLLPLLAVIAAVGAVFSQPGTAPENTVALVAPAPFIAWAVWPGRVTAYGLLPFVAAAELFAQRGGELEPLMFLVCIAAIAIAVTEPSPLGVAAGGTVAVAIPIVVAQTADDDMFYGIWIMGTLLSLVTGRAFRHQAELAANLAAARSLLARQAVVDERQRIARDVHDLVGHGLAAVLLHVTGARHILRRDPDEADRALADAERIGRRSLAELRRTLALLRAQGEGDAAAPPLPGAGNIADAVRTARTAGIDASFKLEGDPERVDPAIGLSLHRVVEEALANAHQHAPRAVTDVALTVGGSSVELTVESIGPLGSNGGRAELPGRPRYGLVGMRERMIAVGGDFEAGPTSAGWIVRCRAPIAPVTAPEV